MAQVSRRPLSNPHSKDRNRKHLPGLKASGWQVRGALPEARSQVLDYVTKCELPAGALTQKLKRDQRSGMRKVPEQGIDEN